MDIFDVFPQSQSDTFGGFGKFECSPQEFGKTKHNFIEVEWLVSPVEFKILKYGDILWWFHCVSDTHSHRRCIADEEEMCT